MDTVNYYVKQTSTDQTFGPIDSDTVREWIRESKIGAADTVCKEGGFDWKPLTTSEFQVDLANQASALAHQAALNAQAASTCPKCGAEMVVMTKSSSAALFLIALGIVTSVACIGVLFLFWGYSLRNNPKVYYTCPRCKYST
jgi:hypothetical protein